MMTRDEAPVKEAWEQYVDRNYSMGGGLPKIHLDELYRGEIYHVGPISHLNAGMMPADLALLMGLASLYKPSSYFEISKRICESIGNMAGVADICYSLHRPVEEMRRKGLRNKYMYMMGSYSGTMENVVSLAGDSRTFDFTTLGRKFDIIFINSGVSYDDVLIDTRKAFEYLVHDRSVVVWHDYSYFPERIHFEVLAGILDGTDPDCREQLFFVSRTKCAIFLKESLLGELSKKA